MADVFLNADEQMRELFFERSLTCCISQSAAEPPAVRKNPAVHIFRVANLNRRSQRRIY
jgi:hypothetical protein